MAGAARVAVVCAFALTTVLLYSGAPAWASSAPAAPGVLPVHPGPHGYFAYTLVPGASTSGTIMVRDLTATPAEYLVYMAEATTSPVGGVAYGQPNSLPPSVSWVHLSTAAVEVAAQGVVPVHFMVAVPAGIAPGDYMAGLVAQTLAPLTTPAPTSSKRGVRLVTTTRVIVAVVVHVPGAAAPAARFGPPTLGLQQHRRQVLSIPINDTGNVLMKPYLAGNLRRCSGGPAVLRIGRQLDTFVPHTSIDYPWYLNHQILPAGCYTAALTLDLGAGGTRLASYSGTVRVGAAATKVQPQPGKHLLVAQPGLPAWLIPAVLAGVLLLLLAVFLLLRAGRDRRRLLEGLAHKDTRYKSAAPSAEELSSLRR